MAYVDLNPVRASVMDTPEISDHTAIQERIFKYANQSQRRDSEQANAKEPLTEESSAKVGSNIDNLPQKVLSGFVGSERAEMPKDTPFSLENYLTPVDWTGRAIRECKSGFSQTR